jgi:hypothetical protein
VPAGCLHAIEFFSDLVSNAIAIGQVKEIARWLKMKNLDAPAVKREEEEDWGKGR